MSINRFQLLYVLIILGRGLACTSTLKLKIDILINPELGFVIGFEDKRSLHYFVRTNRYLSKTKKVYRNKVTTVAVFRIQ